MLTDHGLEQALTAVAARAPVPVEVDVRLPERAPEAVEAAIYYVAAEALTNVAKYAGASAARIRVWADDGAVLAEVADDGAGGADPASGSGLRGLQERVEALRGCLSVESARGEGTTLRVRLPVR